MERADLSDLAAFACIARRRNFRRAAQELGVSPSALSHGLRGLEARLGVRLLNRTSRSVAPTEAGAALLERLTPALSEIGEAVAAATAFGEGVSGRLRINAPRSACRLVLAPVIARFLKAHPGVRVELVADDALRDVVGEGFDAGVRFGETLAQDMIAVPLGGPTEFAVVATSGYLAARGAPATPQDLTDHVCVRQRFPSGALFDWEFEKDGAEIRIAVEGPLTVSDQELALDAALQGGGLAYVFTALAAPAMAEGRLSRVLEDWLPPTAGFYLYHSSRRQTPPALRAFLDLIRRGGG